MPRNVVSGCLWKPGSLTWSSFFALLTRLFEEIFWTVLYDVKAFFGSKDGTMEHISSTLTCNCTHQNSDPIADCGGILTTYLYM